MRLKELSDEEYLEYMFEKIKEEKNYLWHVNGNITIIGKFDNTNGRLFYFENRKYKDKAGVYTSAQVCNLKAEMISEEKLIKVCESYLKLNERDINSIVNLKMKSASTLEGKIPEEILDNLVMESGCAEDLDLNEIYH